MQAPLPLGPVQRARVQLPQALVRLQQVELLLVELLQVQQRAQARLVPLEAEQRHPPVVTLARSGAHHLRQPRLER
jgi:hypothetical protein